MRVFFDRDLDTAATFWRVFRRDGVSFGFTSHDKDLLFDGVNHRSAPGMVPTAIRMTSDLSDDSAGVEGALSHSSIRATDLAAGLFDNASIEIGLVDWESLDNHILYSGSLGQIEDNGIGFSAELYSAKKLLEDDLVPRTSPTCRAFFCGPGCGLSSALFTHRSSITVIDLDLNRIQVAGLDTELLPNGRLLPLAGPQTGVSFGIPGVADGWLTLDRPIDPLTEVGTVLEITQGCDHTHQTCANRFNNAKNFRGEPFLPGNDLLSRYGQGGK